jgi:hypothetical protein
MTLVRSTAEDAKEAADRELDRVAWNLPRAPVPARVQEAPPNDELDWEAFVTAFFPGSRRHDLKALVAYAAHKRARQPVVPSADEE